MPQIVALSRVGQASVARKHQEITDIGISGMFFRHIKV